MNNLIENPIFISGHTRSGTNLLMRILDGSPNVQTPPGEGKLNVLRKFSWDSPLDSDNEHRFLRIFKTLELNLKEDKLEKFLKVLRKAVYNNNSTGFKSDLQIVLKAINNYRGENNDTELKCWLEKNHNLEFYWARALMAFSSPRMYVMVRDPRDVWGSWREELKKTNSNTSPEQMRRNMQQHLVEEILESSLGVSRFENYEELLDYYKVPKENVPDLDKCIREVAIKGVHGPEVNGEIIDTKSFAHSNKEAGRFAWNYRTIAERAHWLEKSYPKNAAIVGYEELTRNPFKTVERVANHCGIQLPSEIAPTEIGENWGGNSSFESGFKGVSTNSIGRWKDRLNDEEITAIMDVAWKSYKSSVKWSEEA